MSAERYFSDESSDESSISSEELMPAKLKSSVRRRFLGEMTNVLPEQVKNRIVALKNLQFQHMMIASQFTKEVFELKKKYHEAMQPFYKQRARIISGKIDPPKEEPKYKEAPCERDAANLNKKDFEKLMKEFKDIPKNTKGFPGFWLAVFKNTELLSELIQPDDEEVLKALNDIKIVYKDDSFILEFRFGENIYFSNRKLTKQYFVRTNLEKVENLLSSAEPEIYKCKGCDIAWNPKMNLTLITLTKRQKNKSTGAYCRVVKKIPQESFFNFFNPPTLADDGEDKDIDAADYLAVDYQIGRFFHDAIIPKAVLYFTGDLIDGTEKEEEDDEDEDDSNESSSDASDDSDETDSPRLF